jgi:hypothetical protein
MIRRASLLVVLAATVSTAATAQVFVQPQGQVVIMPAAPAVVVVPQSTVITPGIVATRVYVPVGLVQTTLPQDAPFAPSPANTYIDTTAGKKVVRSVSNFDVVFDEGGAQKHAYALLMDGLEDEGHYSHDAVAQMWPLTVGKSDSINFENSSGARSISFKVLRNETVTLPAGMFYTYVVERRDRVPTTGTENVATYWYAPSIGAVVKFVEQLDRPGKARPGWELVSIRLPSVIAGSTVIPVTRRVDTLESQALYCQERGTTLRLSDGRVLVFDCPTYLQADRVGYDNWLIVR